MNHTLRAVGALAIAATLWAGSRPVAGQDANAATAPSGPLVLDGFTEPWRLVEVAAAEAGVLAAIEVRPGDTVAVGQTLARLDTQALQASRAIAVARTEAHGQHDLARAECALRRQRLVKLQALGAEGHARPDELERAAADLAVAEANCQAADEEHRVAQLELARIDALIEQRSIRSPMAGVVTRVEYEVAEFIPSHQPQVVTVAELHVLKVRFAVPLTAAGHIRAGGVVPLDVPELGRSLEAHVDYVSPVVDAESGTIEVSLQIDNAAREIPCGIRCQWAFDERLAVRHSLLAPLSTEP